MAYIDKTTSTRRLALIRRGYPEDSNGAVVYEGCDIEGEILLSSHEGYIRQLTILEKDLARFCDDMGLDAVYQDPEDEDLFEPRQQMRGE